MEPASARIATPPPSTIDLERAMATLGVPDDPAYLAKDHPDARRRAELLAHLAAWAENLLHQAESQADLSVDDRADVHWAADLDAAAPRRRPPDTARLLNPQLDRLAWVQHAVVRARGPQAHGVADIISTVLGALIKLITTWQDAIDGEPPGEPTEQVDPMLTDGLLMLREAADQLVRVLPPRAAVGRSICRWDGTLPWPAD